MKSERIKVLLADDHDVVRAGLRTLIEGRGYHVCGEAGDGDSAIRLVAESTPDIVVLDMQLGEVDGLMVTREITQRQPRIEVLIFTMHDDDRLIRSAFSAGARAYILKSEGVQTLMKAIECAKKHKPFLAPRASEILLNHFRLPRRIDSGRAVPLTDREREIVQLLAIGRSNKEAAKMLGISVKTVETHRATIMRKLDLSSLVDLVRYAVREHFINA
jgi:DNA-binding NarL/FixJ family response regulator